MKSELKENSAYQISVKRKNRNKGTSWITRKYRYGYVKELDECDAI